MAEQVPDISTLNYGQKRKFPLNEQKQIGIILRAKKAKFEEDKRNPQINKAKYNEKTKRWVHPFTQKGYIQPSVREIFPNLKDVKCDDKVFISATKFVKRCLEKLEKGTFEIEGNDSKTNYRIKGAGPPTRAIEVRKCLFDYFIDVRCCLKGRLPRKLLIAKVYEIYQLYCELKEKAGETPDVLKFTDCWVSGWCKEYGVSLKSPNKRFSIPQDARKRRIIQFLKNVWTVRYFWLKNYKREPNIISADQMPLHRNESSAQKTMNFSGRNMSVYVKENHNLSRERCSVMTVISSSEDKEATPPAEFVFKGTGTHFFLLFWTPDVSRKGSGCFFFSGKTRVVPMER